MAGAPVQAAVSATASGATSSLTTAAFGSATTVGNSILFCTTWFGSPSAVNFSRSGDSGTQVKAGSSATLQMGVWQGLTANSTAGLSVTFSGTAPTFVGLWAQEWSGLVSSGTIIGAGESQWQSNPSPGTGANGITSGNVTPAAQPFTSFGFVVNPNTTTPVPTVGTTLAYTLGTGVWTGIGEIMIMEYLPGVTSLSAIAATFAESANSAVTAGIMLLREATDTLMGQVIQ